MLVSTQRFARCTALTFVIGAAFGCGSSDGGSVSPDDDAGTTPAVDAGHHPPAHDASTGVDAAPPLGMDAGPMTQDDASMPPPPADAATPEDASQPVDAGNPVDSGAPFVPAAHPPFPKLVNGGGPVLTNPVVVPVMFSNYTYTQQVTDMFAGLGTVKTATGAEFWSSAVGEYGVGALTSKQPILLTEQAPASANYFTIPSWLQNKINTDQAFKSVAGPQTIFVILYPKTTNLSGACGYGGYHESAGSGNSKQPYAVVAECPTFGPIGGVDMVTVAASHEVIEAVTDPYPSTPAYSTIDQPNGFAMDAFLQQNDENGDMCTINNGFIRPSQSYPFLIQRGWSNQAAESGLGDPCAPDLMPTQPFVGAAPVMPDMVSVGGRTGPGIQIPVGQSKTVDVQLWSSAPVPGGFTVAARQAKSVNPPTLDFTWDKTTGENGDVLHLTIKAVAASTTDNFESFVIQAYLPNVTTDVQKPAWAGIVTH